MSADTVDIGIGRPPSDAEVVALGKRLSRRPRTVAHALRVAQDRGMAKVGQTPTLQNAMFRMVDVAPACASPTELCEHLAALLEQGLAEEAHGGRHGLLHLASRIADGRLARPLVGGAASLGVRAMAGRFIVAEGPEKAARPLGRLWGSGVAASIDLLGEATVTPAEGVAYAERCSRTLQALSGAARGWPARPLLEADAAGPIARVNLSVKVSALTPLIRPHSPERGREDAARLLRPLMREARERGAHLHVDMESLDSRELVTELVLDLLAEDEFRVGPSVGLVLQAYMRDSEELLERILAQVEAAARQVPLTIRLVKGAYWDHEVIQSGQHGWPIPVWTTKAESDRCFERLSRRLIDAFPLVRPAIASHNLRSIAHAITYAADRGLGRSDLELQVLRGLGDDLQDALAADGHRVRTYCPIGDMVAGMAYLVRRLLENTSNESFLASRAANVDIEELLARP